MKTDFRLCGLGRKKSVTCGLLFSDGETFWPTVKMDQDVFDAMWKYCDKNWGDPKIAEIEHDGFSEDGIPLNAFFVGFREWDLKQKPSGYASDSPRKQPINNSH